MLNLFQLKKIEKKDVIQAFNKEIEIMNSHQFEKFKKVLNVKGYFDDVYKQKL